MDKSESELLADWDVVSSVDTEQGIDRTETKLVADTSSSNSNAEDKADSKAERESETVNEVTTVDAKTAVDTERIAEQVADIEPDADLTNEGDVVSEHTSEASAEEISELVTVIEQITEVDANLEQISEHDDMVEQEAETVSEEVAKPVEGTVEDSEKSSDPNNERTTDETSEKIDDKNNCEDRQSAEPISDYSTSVSTDTNAVDDRATSSSLDSSMEHVHIEYCGHSRVQDIPELIDLVDQDNAAIESSSSDIDIIEENMDESITSSFVHPLSLSISSSIVDTSSVMTTPSEGDKEIKIEKEIEDIPLPIKTESHIKTLPRTYDLPIVKQQPYTETESFASQSETYSKTSKTFQKSRHDDERKGSKQHDYQQDPRSPPRQAAAGLLATILGYLRNMTHFEWSILGGVMLCLYVTVIFNQTNIFAVVERENVVSQMKSMIDELKQDNKLLKDQMLSEMKNEKVFSSFEHQIKELKKENSKLNHMLYDVVKVLEEKKDSHEKYKNKESDYATPFKKEINKLKEHINFLKIDNEDLQKQLVRMRYASYSQGSEDKTEKKPKDPEDEIKPEETSTDEISIDINSLRKWNELITLLTKELGLLSGNEQVTEEKPHSDFKNNISWYWKVFLREFKGTFKDFKENVTSIISDYKQANEKAVSEVYKFVKEFFTVDENNQQFTQPGADSSQWKNIGDFVTDLKEKWSNIKERIYTSDLRNILKDFRKSGEPDRSSEKTRSGVHESHDKKPTDFQFEKKPEQRSTNIPSEPEKKYHQEQANSEDAKWMFKRAELRAELRDTEEEDPSENWFLKRKRRGSDDESENFKY